jgi:hypothetical protein
MSKPLNLNGRQFEHTCQIVNIKNDTMTSIPLTFLYNSKFILNSNFFFFLKKGL